MSKTHTNEVLCDGCGKVVPLILSGSPSLHLSLRGQSVGHRKGDFCNAACLARWSACFVTEIKLGDATLSNAAARINKFGSPEYAENMKRGENV